MILKERLKQLDPDTIVAIGAKGGSSYVAIDHVKDIPKQLKIAENKLLKVHSDKFRRSMYDMSVICREEITIPDRILYLQQMLHRIENGELPEFLESKKSKTIDDVKNEIDDLTKKQKLNITQKQNLIAYSKTLENLSMSFRDFMYREVVEENASIVLEGQINIEVEGNDNGWLWFYGEKITSCIEEYENNKT